MLKARLSMAWLLLPFAGLVELGAELSLASSTVHDDAWAELDADVAALAEPGVPVVVAPRWAEPRARAELGDAWFPVHHLAHSGLETQRRVLEVSLFGHRSPELAGFSERARRARGPFVLRVLDNPRPELVVFDFVDALGPERATAYALDPFRPCRYDRRARARTGGLGGHPGLPSQRFDCGEGPLFDVGVSVVADQSFLPRRCVFAHPPERGARVIRYDGVPLGSEVVLDTGMYWIVERERRGAPVALDLWVDGELVQRVVHEDGDGWARRRIALGEHAGKPSAKVEWRVSTTDASRRHFCFRADTR